MFRRYCYTSESFLYLINLLFLLLWGIFDMKNLNVTLSMPEDLKHEMESFKEINWSEVMRSLLAEKLKRLRLLKKLDALTAESSLTEGDVNVLSEKIKEGIAKR